MNILLKILCVNLLIGYSCHIKADSIVVSKPVELVTTNKKNMQYFFGGRLKDDFFIYNNVYTFRNDYHDHHDFVRHRLNLDFAVKQHNATSKKTISEAMVRLCNYVYWQRNEVYTPMVIDEITSPTLNGVALAKNIPVKTLVPLIFVEQAMFTLHLDQSINKFKQHATTFTLGYFPYQVGRGVALGKHNDLAIDYLGMPGDGGFTRYPYAPPGLLFQTRVNANWVLDLYFNLWRETDASISDVLKQEHFYRMDAKRPERGSGKDRMMLVGKGVFTKDYLDWAKMHFEPYVIYLDAPEQSIEFTADASSKLWTFGCMTDLTYNEWRVNIEIAGQCGYQRVHAIDRNIQQVGIGGDGIIKSSLSHVLLRSSDGKNSSVGAGVTSDIADPTRIIFDPPNQLATLVNFSENRTDDLPALPAGLSKDQIRYKGIAKTTAIPAGGTTLFNSTVFGNSRFRKGYTLYNQGFMGLIDIVYKPYNSTMTYAAAVGHIAGDRYPYNDEISRPYQGFIPLRSEYKGLAVKNFLIFDRLVIPRPLNIAYRTLLAPNNVKDLSNMQYIGIGATWMPEKHHKKLAITTDIMMLWEATALKKWDVYGVHSDPAIEAQLKILRNTTPEGVPTKFSGWESDERARRKIGTEFDVRFVYKILDNCMLTSVASVFIPGGLYKDLWGQPNTVTQRTDENGFVKFDSLGSQPAYSFMIGMAYSF